MGDCGRDGILVPGPALPAAEIHWGYGEDEKGESDANGEAPKGLPPNGEPNGELSILLDLLSPFSRNSIKYLFKNG